MGCGRARSLVAAGHGGPRWAANAMVAAVAGHGLRNGIRSWPLGRWAVFHNPVHLFHHSGAVVAAVNYAPFVV